MTLMQAGPKTLAAGWEKYVDGSEPTNNPTNFNYRVYAGTPDANSSNVELYWDYVQGICPATQFHIKITAGSTSHSFRVRAVAATGTQKHRADVLQLSKSLPVTITIAAEFVGARGVSSKTAVTGWSFTPNSSSGSTLAATQVGFIDWTGGNVFYNTQQYRNNIEPNGAFGTFSEPSIISNPDASIDLVLQFTFSQGSAYAGNFLIFYNDTGAYSSIADAAYSIDARPSAGTQTYTVRILGVNPTNYYSYAVAACAATQNGRSLNGLYAPASWQNFRPAAAANYTGNIDSVSASTVKSNAANGQTAFSDTEQFRNNYPPSNAPTNMTLTYERVTNGAYGVVLGWSYTQGANIATHFAIFVKRGGGTISASDPHFLVGGNARQMELPMQLAPDRYSFAIAAVAVTKSGSTFNATLLSWLNSDTIDVDVWIGNQGCQTRFFEGLQANFQIPVYLQNTLTINGLGAIDLMTQSGVLKLRKVFDNNNPPTAPAMTANESIIMVCSAVNKFFFVHYDGANRFYIGVNWATGTFTGGMNIF